MNIQKISFNQNFGVKIGPKLQAEIDRKREELAKLPNSKSHIRPAHFESRVNIIKSLLPDYKGSPITAEIKEKVIKKGRKTIRIPYYLLTSEDGNFYKKFKRDQDGLFQFDRYTVLIGNLRDFEEQEKEGTLVSGLKPQPRSSSETFKSNDQSGEYSDRRRQYSDKKSRYSSQSKPSWKSTHNTGLDRNSDKRTGDNFWKKIYGDNNKK